MSTFVSTLRKSAARAQRELAIKAGEVYLRGGRLVWVLNVGDGAVTWREAAGERRTETTKKFRERALRRVRIPVDASPTPLERAWQTARARTVPGPVRISVLARARRRRPRREYRAQIAAWIEQIATGVDPTFEAEE